jgi:hypothetical protein
LGFIFPSFVLGKRAIRGARKLLWRSPDFIRCCLVKNRRAELDIIVIGSPEHQLHSGVIQAAYEAFDKCILLSLSQIIVILVEIIPIGSFQDLPTEELCAIITHNTGKLSREPHERFKFSCNTRNRYAGVSRQTQLLTMQWSFTAKIRDLQDTTTHQIENPAANVHRVTVQL